MAQTTARLESVIGRETEMRRLQIALREPQSQLMWGATDSGKTSLIEAALSGLSEVERGKCIRWSGPAQRRQFVEHSNVHPSQG
jgi:ABC-type transport system involved in cytochrome c biogenesis ATPase subunit